jgi:hypothetical protein
MTQPANVIYLPPGVIAPISQQPAPPIPSGVPFDKSFFEQILPASVLNFCQNTECDTPIVELWTVDGSRHFVKGISGVADSWVALHTQSSDHERPIQVFLPYQTIYRVEIHPEDDAQQRRLGFVAAAESGSEAKDKD